MFIYQPTFDTLKLKKDEGTDHFIGWKSKGVYNSKSTLLHGAFLPTIIHKIFETNSSFHMK